MNFILGIDVATAKREVALRFAHGKLHSKVVDNTPRGFEAWSVWLAKPGITELHVGMQVDARLIAECRAS